MRPKHLFGNHSLDDQINLILTIQTNGGANAVFHGMSETNLQTFLRHPNTMATFDDPHHYAAGFRYALVNGVIIVKDDVHTQARPGKALRHSF